MSWEKQSSFLTHAACRLTRIVGVALVVCQADSGFAQTLSVREIVSDSVDLKMLADREKTVHISGRYDGRLGSRIRLAKLPVEVVPQRSVTLPENMRTGQRLTVSGLLRRTRDIIVLDTSRISIGTTDVERLASRAQQLRQNQPSEMYALADEFQELAEFYDDQELRNAVQSLRLSAFQNQRAAVRGDSAGLQRLAESAETRGFFSEDLIASVRFESVIAAAKTGMENGLSKRIQESLPGWNEPSKAEPFEHEALYLRDPVSAFEASDERQRRQIVRLVYRRVRLAEILNQLKTDGSNGLNMADQLQKELPEETAAILKAREAFVQYRLQGVPTLNRRQLEDLVELLTVLRRESGINSMVTEWLQAQERRLENGQLDGVLASAEEYLFAWERWKTEAWRQRAVELLKRGWGMARDTAPQEADAIAKRLEQLGWTHLRGQWMTSQDVANLPGNDIDLAMKEGRVVKGMSPAQVLATLGEPSRKVRLLSARLVSEIWIYGDVEGSGITVHLERGRHVPSDKAAVTLVSRSR